MKTKITILLLLVPIMVHSQNISRELKKYMQSVQSGEPTEINDQRWYTPENSREVLDNVVDYLKEENVEVQKHASSVILKTGKSSTDAGIRKECVNLLLGECREKDPGLVGYACKALKQFKKQDFDRQAQETLKELIEARPPHYEKIILLNGFVGGEGHLKAMQEAYVNDTLLNSRETWALQMAMARLGDKKHIVNCLQYVKSMDVNDKVVYDILPDLVYIRQKETLDYLVDILKSDEKNCLPANPEYNTPILCGYRVMEYLAPVLQDFPLHVGPSGDIGIDDYEQALATARQYFEMVGNNYRINKNIY